MAEAAKQQQYKDLVEPCAPFFFPVHPMGPGSVCVCNSLSNRYRLLVITLEELTNRIAVLLMMHGPF